MPSLGSFDKALRQNVLRETPCRFIAPEVPPVGRNRPSFGTPSERGLLCHRAERQYSFAEQFVKHLRESGVNRGESAEDSFITGEMFEPATGCSEIAVGEQEEQDRERCENNL